MNRKKSIYRIILIICFINVSLANIFGQVITYPSPEGISPSYKYRVTVDGQNSFVYMGCGAHFTQFSFGDSADIVVDVIHGGFASAEILNNNGNIPVSRNGKSISFQLSDSITQICIEFDQKIDPLFIFANPFENRDQLPDKDDKSVYYFGPGIHEPGVIDLNESKKTVYLAGGAYVKGCIRATNLDDVKIFGRGILSGEVFDNRPLNSEWHNMISLKGCNHTDIEGVVLYNSQAWNILVLLSNHVNVFNVKEVSSTGNSDGIDICGANHVLIDKCFMYVNDDCIAFNNLICSFDYNWENGGMRPNTNDIRLINSVLWNQSWGTPIRLGWNTMCEYQSNILFRNIDIIHCENGVAIDMNHGDAGSFSNIVFDNIRIQNVPQVLSLQMGGNRTCIDPVNGLSETNGIHFKNIYTSSVCNTQNRISGENSTNNIKNVSFTNFNFDGKKINSLEDLNCDTAFVQNIVFSNDSTAPGAPEITKTESANPYCVELEWYPSNDEETKIIHYNVYKNGEFLNTSSKNCFVDYTCRPSTDNVYTISAVNSVGLESNLSQPKQIKTQRAKNTWKLSEYINGNTRGYGEFFYLTYNTKPMKFYRMPESGYELASRRYSYSPLRFWDMYYDGIGQWHSISNTRDTKSRMNATLTQEQVMSPDSSMDVVIGWKVPLDGKYSLSWAIGKVEKGGDGMLFKISHNSYDDHIYNHVLISGDKTKMDKLQLDLAKGEFIYFIAGSHTGDTNGDNMKIEIEIVEMD